MCRRFSLIALIPVLLACFPAYSFAQRLHAFVLADQSEWAQWGEFLPNVQMDEINMRGVLENNIPKARLNLPNVYFEEGVITPQGIMRRLSEFQVGPQDAFLFYFSGHGEADDRGHYLSVQGGKLYRSEILGVIRAKQPRLMVVLTDCCNVRGDGEEFFAPYIENQPPARISPLFDSLLFERKGVIDINSSSPGQSAFFFPRDRETGAAEGSLFTGSLVNYLWQYRQQRKSWDELVRDVSMAVDVAFQRNYPKGATTAKGKPVQRRQSVHAISYPGMPQRQGPRTGLTIRDHPRGGAQIISVRPDFPGTRVFHLEANRHESLYPGQVIVAANDRPIANARQFVDAVKNSPPALRLGIRTAYNRQSNYVLWLRY